MGLGKPITLTSRGDNAPPASFAPDNNTAYAFVARGGEAMFQIIDSITTTCMKLVNEHGWRVGAVVGGLAVLAIGLPIVARVLRHGGSK